MRLIFWNIFQRPLDYPQEVVIRQAFVEPGQVLAGPLVWRGQSVEEARRNLPPGLFCIPRSPEDVGSLVESWV
jgi:hypothetical protein